MTPPHLSPPPFDAFLKSVESASYDEFRRLPGAEVENARAFEEMKAYLLDLYRDARATESFVDADGQIMDCIAEEQHPAARRWNGVSLPEPPEAPPSPPTVETEPPHPVTPSNRAIANVLPRDHFREAARAAPPGTTPMYRTTLQQLTRFRSLAAFSVKDRPPDAAAPVASSFPKRYATGEQDVDCDGGASYVNVWKPFATPTYQGTFSQQWYVAGHGGTLLQTVECGWHVDYARYGDSEPHLFVYTTRHNYDPGHSYFNEDGGVFRLVANPPVRPGVRLYASQTDGTQVEYKMGYFRTSDAWWFYFNDQPVGCYPLAWFDNGPITTKATRAKFGGEVGSGISLWPPMGSGQHASAGYGKAAYQRGAFVHLSGAGPLFANLAEAGSVTGPCYTIDITNNSPSVWATYLFFGGPGGSPC